MGRSTKIVATLGRVRDPGLRRATVIQRTSHGDPAVTKPTVGPRGLAVREQGPVDALLVVLVHGSMDRSSGMRRAARALADDFRVVIYDRRGYGRSVGVGPPFGVDEQVEDLVAVIDGRPAVVFGHSFGGDVALAAAERHPALGAGGRHVRSPHVVGAVVARRHRRR